MSGEANSKEAEAHVGSVEVLVRGPPHVSGGPSQTMIRFVLSWEQVRELVRTARMPDGLIDEAIVQILSIGAAPPPHPHRG